jgi:WS/DGAT/MGAT family acyltransferase
MQRLTGADATFLYLQTPTSHMEVGGVIVLDASKVEGGVSYERARALIEARLHLVPPFRRRLVHVPFELDNPRWIEDPDFDLDFHLRPAALPAPGGMAELARYAAEVMSRPLDLSRPLWEMHIVEGLEGGRAALISKTHHAAIDGVSGAELIAAMVDLEPDAGDPQPPEHPWQPDAEPSELALVADSLATLARQPFRGIRSTQRLVRALLRDQLSRRSGSGVTGFTDAPKTVFNVGVTPHRRVELFDLPLDDIKAVKNATGTKVNDVILAVCGGALRQYLLRHHSLPDQPLVAFVPLSTRPDDQRDALGNQVSVVFSTLATDVADPLGRLRAISGAMAAAKEQHNAVGAATLTDWTEIGGPTVAALAGRVIDRLGVNQRLRAGGNVVVSNVPGPPIPLYVAGAPITAIYPLGPVADGNALNITVMSHLDQVHVGLSADRETVPDLPDLVDDLTAALAELVAVAVTTAVPAAVTTDSPTGTRRGARH